MAVTDFFSIQVFFLIFREVLESAIIVSVLLSFLKRSFDDLDETLPETQALYRKLRLQVWAGAAAGILLCGIIGSVFIIVFQFLGKNLWNKTEKLWEAFFCIVASVMITVMGRSMLRVNRMQQKWKVKLAKAIVANEPVDGLSVRNFTRKYSLAILPMVTTLREGLEAVAFLGGLGISVPSTAIPLSTLCALALGGVIGLAIYKYGCDHGSIRTFVLISTCFLYLVAAGLLSRGVWFIEMHRFIQKVGQDVSESGSGPGSYDISNTIWHVDCCNPETDGPFMIFNGILGWQNTATYGSVISYNLYWIVLCVLVFRTLRREKIRQSQVLDAEEEEHGLLFDRAAAVLRNHNTHGNHTHDHIDHTDHIGYIDDTDQNVTARNVNNDRYSDE